MSRQAGYIYDDYIGYCKLCTGKSKSAGTMALVIIGVVAATCCAVLYKFRKAIVQSLVVHFAVLKYIRKNFTKLRVKGKILVSGNNTSTNHTRAIPVTCSLRATHHTR